MPTTQIKSGGRYDGATFERLKQPGATVSQATFADCEFSYSDLSEVAFYSCRFIECQFTECNLRLVNFSGSALVGPVFDRCNLMGINWTEADWQDWSAKMAPLSFQKCDLRYSVFHGLALPRLTLKDCTAHEASFAEADLTGADLTCTDFARAIFLRTDLTRANFAGAKNYALKLTDNTTAGTKFSLPEAARLLYYLDIEIVDDETHEAIEEDELNRFVGNS